MGRMLIISGLVLIALGVLFVLGERLPVKFGKLPGDIVWRGKNTTVYFPVVTSILLSVILTFVLWLINRR